MKSQPYIQISIPQPCHEDWNKMTPQQQGRFCDSCQKCVVDFTGFSDADLYSFFTEHKGQKVCGRINSHQLNKQINIPHQPNSALYRWMMAAGLALVFVAAPEAKSFAQAPIIQLGLSDTSHRQHDNVTDSVEISGTVLDDNNEPVIAAEVIVRSANYEKHYVTDFDGNYSITVPPGTYDLVVKYIGFKQSVTTKIKGDRSTKVNVKLHRADEELYGDIIMTTGYVVPLINKFEGGNTRTITSDEIEKGAY